MTDPGEADPTRWGGPTSALLPPSDALLMPPGPLLVEGFLSGVDAQVVSAELASRLVHARQLGAEMAFLARATAAKHAPELRRRATAAARTAETGASAMLTAAAGAANTAGQAWHRSGERPGLRRAVLLGGVAGLAVIAGLGWLIAEQRATSYARREIPAVLARLGLTDTVSYAGVTASPFGTTTLEQVAWRIGSETVKSEEVIVNGLAKGPSGLHGAQIETLRTVVPVAGLRDVLPPELRKMLLGLGYVSPRVDFTLNFDLEDERRALSLDIGAKSPDIGKIELRLNMRGVTTDTVAPLLSVYAQKLGLQPDRRFDPGDMFAMRSAMQTMVELSIASGAVTLDDTPLMTRARTIPARSIPDEPPSPQDTEGAVRLSNGLATLVVPDERERAKQDVLTWLKNGGRLVISADPSTPLHLFSAGLGGEPIPLDLEQTTSARQYNVTVSR